jgi:phosphoserine phosphatase RsbX
METLNPATVLHREAGIEWSVVSRALPGEHVCGDQYLVAPTRHGVLLAAIDGLGHGDAATLAARKAVEALAAHADQPVIALMQECHRALRDTRGAAITLVTVNPAEGTAAALGVGNVEMVLVRGDRAVRPPRESALLRNGVVGYRLPALHASLMTIAAGDVLVFATDGVREDFGDRVDPTEPLPLLVERILGQKFRGTDDALVLAGKVLPR